MTDFVTMFVDDVKSQDFIKYPLSGADLKTKYNVKTAVRRSANY